MVDTVVHGRQAGQQFYYLDLCLQGWIFEPPRFYSSSFALIGGRANHGWDCNCMLELKQSWNMLKLSKVFNLAGGTAWLSSRPPNVPCPLGSSGTCTSDGAQHGWVFDMLWRGKNSMKSTRNKITIWSSLLFHIVLDVSFNGVNGHVQLFYLGISALNQPWTDACTFSLELAAGSLESSAMLSRSPPRTEDGWCPTSCIAWELTSGNIFSGNILSI